MHEFAGRIVFYGRSPNIGDAFDLDEYPPLLRIAVLHAIGSDGGNAEHVTVETTLLGTGMDRDAAYALWLAALNSSPDRPAYNEPFDADRYAAENPHVMVVSTGKVYKNAGVAAAVTGVSTSGVFNCLNMVKGYSKPKGYRFVRTRRPLTQR